MLDRDVKVNIRKIVETVGAFNTPVYSAEKNVYGTLKDSGADEKERAIANGLVNSLRVDINEEEFDDETEAHLDGKDYDIYKTATVKNKVYLYLTDKETGG